MLLCSFIFMTLTSAFANEATNPLDLGRLPGLEDIRKNDGFENIEITKFVSLDTYEKQEVQGYQLGCDGTNNGKIGFCARACSEMDKVDGTEPGLVVSKPCAEILNDFMPKCLEAIGCVKSASFCGSGGFAKRTVAGSTTPSRHSTGDALDLVGLRCMDADGKDASIQFIQEVYKSDPRQRERYDKFTACWRNQVQEYNKAKGTNCGGVISCVGSEGVSNGDHNDHIHISCPVTRGNVSTI